MLTVMTETDHNLDTLISSPQSVRQLHKETLSGPAGYKYGSSERPLPLPEKAHLLQSRPNNVNISMSLSPFSLVQQLSEPDTETLTEWNKCRFVRQGWFTA